MRPQPYTGYFAMATAGDRFIAVYGNGGDRSAREVSLALNWFDEAGRFPRR